MDFISKKYLLKLLLIVWCFVEYGTSIDGENLQITVKTKQGLLEGLTRVSRGGKEFFSFLGIPYAETPERFQASVLHKGWEGVKKATAFGNSCPQFHMPSNKISGDEDCLFINVHTPAKLTESNQVAAELPVIVWIHDGGFEVGKSDLVDAKYFADENVILVSMNYRLGALGFLCVEDKSVSVNNGIKDQVLALQWVKENIEFFGGNPKMITIMGASAGGVSVHYHLLSPMSSDLFRNAISHSGSALSPFSIQRDPVKLNQRFATLLSCPIDDASSMVDCMKSKTHPELIMAQLGLAKWAFLPFNNFAPCVETSKMPGKPFLTDYPIRLIEEGKVAKKPWITGFTEEEGIILAVPLTMNPNYTYEMNEKWQVVMPVITLTEDILPENQKANVMNKILKFYFGPDDIDETTVSELGALIGDRYFVHPIDKSARLHAKHSMVYAFEFTFPSFEDSPALSSILGVPGHHGVTHLDDHQYLFNEYHGSKFIDDSNLEVFEFSKKFVKLWASFAKNSAPTTLWGKLSEWSAIPKDIGNDPIKYFQVSTETSISPTDLSQRISLWEELEIYNDPRKSTKDEL